MSKLVFLSALVVALAARVAAQGTRCGPDIAACPASAPCCSEFGFCGTGAQHCLGGCNPFWSNTPDSCRAMPVCRDAEYTFPSDMARLIKADIYDGNSSAYDWTIDEGSALNTNNNGGELALILTQDDRASKGTRISTTKYVHYGTITATVRTGMWNGVVTAFITMSNVKDEIDWEWPGNHVTEAQSNFFFMGHVDYTAGNGATHGDLSDTYQNFHDYTIDWQPETLRFLIDGVEVRSVNKADTLVNGKYEYPTTPARVQVSLWAGGLAGASQGVIDWSGGLIQYNEPDYVAFGNQYQALVSKVTVQCSSAPETTITADTVSYVYGANDTNGIPTVLASNQTTLLHDNAAVAAGVRVWVMAGLASGAAALLSW